MRADGRIRAYRSGTRLVRFDLNEIDALMGHSNGNGTAPTEPAQTPRRAQARKAIAKKRLGGGAA